jgi:hypothetical protein
MTPNRKSAGDPHVKHSAPPDDGEPRQDDVLSVERHRKADGRLLILYKWDRRADPSRREQDPAGATNRRGSHADASAPGGEHG